MAGTVGGIVVAGTGGGGTDDSRLTSGSVSLEAPRGWHQTDLSAGALVPLSESLTASPGGNSDVVVGLPRDAGSAERALDGALLKDTPRAAVQLGELQAWRYSNLQTGNGQRGVAYLSYTTGGPVLIECHSSPAGARARLAQCARAAATVRVEGQEPVTLATVEKSRASLQSALSGLYAARSKGRERFANAPVARVQAAAGRSLQRDFRVAAKRVEAIEPPFGAESLQDIAAALDETAAAYGNIARATSRGNAAAYDKARRAIVTAEAKVRRAIARADSP